MADLDERFRSLSRTASPDLWSDIETREPRSGIPPTPWSHRAFAAAVALVIATVGIGFAIVSFGDSEPSTTTGTSGVSGAAVSNGSIAFTSYVGGYHISTVGLDGAIREVTVPSGGDYDLGPSWSPDGRRLAFLRYTRGDYELMVADADGSEVTSLGRPAQAFGWAPDGTEIAFTIHRPESDADVVIADASGAGLRELVTTPLSDSEPDWSPTGEWIAFVSHPVLDRDPGSADIFVVRPDGTGLRKLTDGPAWESSPVWSPDGSKIAYLSDGDRGEIFVMNADGSDPTRITDAPGDLNDFAWSPDGTQLAFGVYSGTSWDIHVVNADGSGQTVIADGPKDETGVAWSPDGTLLAYAAAESAESCQCDNSGTFEVYVMEPDGSGESRLTQGANELGGGLSWQTLPG